MKRTGYRMMQIKSQMTQTDPRDADSHAHRMIHQAGRSVSSTDDGRRFTVNNAFDRRRAMDQNSSNSNVSEKISQ